MSVDVTSNTPGEVNWTIRKGASWGRTLQLRDKATGTALPLTGYTARMQIRRSAGDPAVMLDLTIGNGRIAINEELGQIGIHIDLADTMTLQHGVYDLEIVAPSGDVTALIGGAVRVAPEVTR